MYVCMHVPMRDMRTCFLNVQVYIKNPSPFQYIFEKFAAGRQMFFKTIKGQPEGLKDILNVWFKFWRFC